MSEAQSNAMPAKQKNRLARLRAHLDERTDKVAHGPAVLIVVDGIVVRAENVLFPDGSRGNPTNISLDRSVVHDCVWLRPIGTGKLGCRGRLQIKDGKDVVFIDDPQAVQPKSKPLTPSLQRDLAASQTIRAFAATDVGAAVLYGALQNGSWRHSESGTVNHISQREAGGIVAGLQGDGTYMDWYMHPTGGLIDGEVVKLFRSLGWDLIDD